MSDLEAEIEAEIAECERLEELARTQAALEAEAGSEWADVATKTGVPMDYKQRR